MEKKLKPCPFCGNAPDAYGPDRDIVCCPFEECPVSGSFGVDQWNKRPSEDKLKLAIDCALRAMELAMDNNVAKPIVIQRMKQAIPQIKTILGITKKREF